MLETDLVCFLLSHGLVGICFLQQKLLMYFGALVLFELKTCSSHQKSVGTVEITHLQVIVCFIQFGSGDIMFMCRLVCSYKRALFFLLGLSKAFLRFFDGLKNHQDINMS